MSDTLTRYAPFDFGPFIAFWRTEGEAFARDLYESVVAALPAYASLPRAELEASIARKAALWQQLLLTGDISEVLATTRRLAMGRASARVPLREMTATGDLFRDQVWSLLRRFYPEGQWPIAAVEQMELWTRDDRNEIIAAYSDALQSAWAEVREREQTLEQQQQLIQALSTPIIPIYEGVLVLPLVGHIDQQRASRIAEEALEQIVAAQADILLLDVTGVPLVDASVAQHLMQLARAVQLIGAEVALVGISPEIAQMLVQLDFDLSHVPVRATLQDGIAYALLASRR